MGKNHRHKKNLKSERAKVKLRVKTEKTKFLPKGLNVTKTDFKVKPIILAEQLKEKDSADLLSTRKLNVKDILSRLRHHNSTIRYNSLNEMKQLINFHLDALVDNHLAQIVQGLPPLLLDGNSSIRTNVISILQKILEKVDKGKLVPFYGTLSSYLRCSMTNINRDIQEDSLHFLAILLQFVPQMISDEKQKLLPNLFSLISRLKTESKPARTLSVNLNTKLTSVKWHIKVLSSIYGVLKAINAYYIDLPIKTPDLPANKMAAKFVPVFRNNYLINKRNVYLNTSLTTTTQQHDVLERNASSLITLLYEMWIEVAPEKELREMNNFVHLNNDAAAVLSCILNVLYMLHIHILHKHKDKAITYARDLFCTNDYKNLVQNVLAQFPFAQLSEKASKNEQSIIQKVLQQHVVQDTKFARENLLICYFFCNLNKRLASKNVAADANVVLKYIEYCLVTRGYITNMNADCLLLVIKTVFFDNTEWCNKLDMEKILICFISFYNHFKTSHGMEPNAKTNEILHVLCDFVQLPHLNRNDMYQTWLHNLSAMLQEEQISEKILDALLLVAKQGNVEFLTGLQKRFVNIVENYRNIKVVNNFHDNNVFKDNSTYNVSKLKILCLFFYLPQIHSSDVLVLKKFCFDCLNVNDLQLEKNIIEQLLNKFGLTCD